MKIRRKNKNRYFSLATSAMLIPESQIMRCLFSNKREHLVAPDSPKFIFGHPLILVQKKRQHDCKFGVLGVTGDGDVCRRAASIEQSI